MHSRPLVTSTPTQTGAIILRWRLGRGTAATSGRRIGGEFFRTSCQPSFRVADNSHGFRYGSKTPAIFFDANSLTIRAEAPSIDRLEYTCGSTISSDCNAQFRRNSHGNFRQACNRCRRERGANPLRNRCELCCSVCKTYNSSAHCVASRALTPDTTTAVDVQLYFNYIRIMLNGTVRCLQRREANREMFHRGVVYGAAPLSWYPTANASIANLTVLVRSRPTHPDPYLWLGLNYSCADAAWKWADGTFLDNATANWAPGHGGASAGTSAAVRAFDGMWYTFGGAATCCASLGLNASAPEPLEWWGFSDVFGLVQRSELGHNFNRELSIPNRAVYDGNLRIGRTSRQCHLQTNLSTILGTTPLGSRTIEAFVNLHYYSRRSAQGVMGIQTDPGDENRFDSIVYGDRKSFAWSAYSTGRSRTRYPLPGNYTFREQSQPDYGTSRYVHIAITYSYDSSCNAATDPDCPGTIQIYRNGELYGDAYNASLKFYNNRLAQNITDFVYFGKGNGRCSSRGYGLINCAGLYDRALTPAEVKASYALGCCGRGYALGDLGVGCDLCGTGLTKLHAACEKPVVVSEPRNALLGAIPRADIASVSATSVFPPTGQEAENGTFTTRRYGQCQPQFAIDDGDEYFNCRGHCFETTGTSGAQSMTNQYLQVNLAVPKNLTAIGVRGIYAGPAWGVLYSFRLSYSLDNVSWIGVDNGVTYQYPTRGSNKIRQRCNHPLRIQNFSVPVVARHLRLHPLSWKHHPSVRLQLYGCDALLDHGYYERVDVPTLASQTARRGRRAAYAWNSSTSLMDGIRFTTDLLGYPTASTTQRNLYECAAACHSDYVSGGQCFSWVYQHSTGACRFRASPVIAGYGTANTDYISGNMPEPSATGYCDYGWTGPFCTIRDDFVPPLSLQIPDYTFGNPAVTAPTDEFKAFLGPSGTNYTNVRCVHETVLTSNPSYAASTTVVTAGSSGVLPRDQCAKLCSMQRLCVGFRWKSNFECTTFRRCDSGLTGMAGLGQTTAYLYLRRDHASRLNASGNATWQAFAVGASKLVPTRCAAEGDLCSCQGYVVYGAAGGWTPPLYLNGTSIRCSPALLGNPSGSAPSPRECRCLNNSELYTNLDAHDGSFNKTSFLFDGVRSHGGISTGLWFSEAGWTGEDFVEVPVSAAGLHTIAAVIVWSACTDPGLTHPYSYTNEGAIVTLRKTNGL